MASGRILNTYNTIILLAAGLLLTVSGCSTPGITGASDREIEEIVEEIKKDERAADILSELNIDGVPISTLADLYASQQNEIPEVFSRIKTYAERETDVTKGFRIQIYSGESVTAADTIAAKFRGWVSTYIDGYQADTYTFFKTPYYRVHVGDFHNRDMALKYSRLLKREFKDAWVVYDSVDPFMVPEDTVHFSLIQEESAPNQR